MTNRFRTTALSAALFATAFSGAALAQDAGAGSATPTPTPSPPAPAAASPAADGPITVAMKGPDGSDMGTVEVTSTPLGVLFKADLSGLPQGTHAFHIHETGKCDGDFTSAGGHYNPGDNAHGFLAAEGPHAGDMTNFVVPSSDGAAEFEEFNAMVTLAGSDAPLNDADGSALMVHSGADDYISQPTGDAGGRISCGVIYAAP